MKIFERNNNASVNIYGLDKDLKNKNYVYPLRIAPNFVESNHFDLLYLQEDDAPDRVNGHYCLITDLARLVHSQITTNTGRVYICRRCLKHFGQQDLLDSHKRLCETRDPINAAMPSGDRPVTKFKNFKFQQHIPYIVYADFECALEPFSTAARDPSLAESFTEKRHRHVPTSWCYYIVSHNEADNNVYSPKLYRGPNTVRCFWDSLREDLRKIDAIYKNIVPINIDDEARALLIATNNRICHICKCRFPDDAQMVIDHCHLTGKVRG